MASTHGTADHRSTIARQCLFGEDVSSRRPSRDAITYRAFVKCKMPGLLGACSGPTPDRFPLGPDEICCGIRIILDYECISIKLPARGYDEDECRQKVTSVKRPGTNPSPECSLDGLLPRDSPFDTNNKPRQASLRIAKSPGITPGIRNSSLAKEDARYACRQD